jgi:hypothetical protein
MFAVRNKAQRNKHLQEKRANETPEEKESRRRKRREKRKAKKELHPENKRPTTAAKATIPINFPEALGELEKEPQYIAIRREIQKELAYDGKGYYQVPHGLVADIARRIGLEKEMGCSFERLLHALWASSLDAKPQRGGSKADGWSYIGMDEKDEGEGIIPSNEKRVWKNMKESKFRDFILALSEFLLKDIGTAYPEHMTVIAKPKGVRRGYLHTDAKLMVSNKSAAKNKLNILKEDWDGTKGPSAISLWGVLGEFDMLGKCPHPDCFPPPSGY